jgi:hypothetical protein
MSNTKERPLTKKELKTHEQFARLEVSLDELRNRLGEMLEFDFRPSERRMTWHYRLPEPRVRVELSHIRNAMDRHGREEISTEQLADWATMLLLNEAYDWEGPDEQEIADLLNDLSTLTLKPEAPEKDEASP